MSTAQRAPNVGAVMLDDSLLQEVRRVLADAGIVGCAAFVLVELNEGGLRTAVVDSATGASLIERGDGKLCPRMLDLAMADHLVRSGRVERPTSFEWATELIDLMPDVRARLAVTDGAFAMGRNHVSMVRVSRRDYYAGLQPHLMAAQSLWQSTALNAPLPVGAIVFMPEHEQWPGLYPTLSHLAPIPAVALRDPEPHGPAVGAGHHAGTPTHGDVVQTVTAALHAPRPEPRPALSAVAESHRADSRPAEPAPVDSHPADPRPAESAPVVPTPGPDLTRTLLADAPPVLPAAADPFAMTASRAPQPGVSPSAVSPPAPVTTPVPMVLGGGDTVAVAPGHVLAEVVPAPGGGGNHAVEQSDVRLPTGAYLPDPLAPPVFRDTGEQDVYVPAEFVEAGSVPVPDHGLVKRSAGPRHYTPPAGAWTSSTGGRAPSGTGRRRRVLLGVGVVAGVAVAGAAIVVAVATSDGGRSEGGSAMVAQTSAAPVPGATAPTTSRPPLDTRAARAPMLQYTPPATVESVPTASAAPPRAATPRRRTAPQRRSIPNPIPGLPPILLP